MDNDSYRTNAYKLLAGISDRELREDANLSKIKAMIEACELFLWEINDDILRLKLFHPELMEEGEKYADSGWVNQKWFKEGEYHWMYQLRPAPERAEDYNDYFTRAIYERNNVYIAHFLHYYEGILNRRAERFIETFAIASRYFIDLKLTFVSILWEEFLVYDPANPIPLLQIIKPKVSRAWHRMVAKQIGALTVNEKVYANWRKISAIAKKYRAENLPLEQLEEKLLTELPKLTMRDIRYALQMLPGWRDALPISYKPSPEQNHSYEPRCAYADTLPDTGAEPIDAPLMREEMRKAFTSAFVPLTEAERELFRDANGVDTRTFETFPPLSKGELSFKYDYADESGVNKAEGVLHYKIVAELSEICYTDSVGVVRTSTPKGCEEKKNIFYYKYFPRCEKQGGVIKVDASKQDTLGYEVIEVADGDTMLSHRYARLAAELLNRRRLADEKHKLPWRTMTTWLPKVETDMTAGRIRQTACEKICTEK